MSSSGRVTTSCASAGGGAGVAGAGVGAGCTGVTSPSEGGAGVKSSTGGGADPEPPSSSLSPTPKSGRVPLSVDGGVVGAGVGAAVADGVGDGVGVATTQTFLSQSLIAALTASRKSGKSMSSWSEIDCSVRLSDLPRVLAVVDPPVGRGSRGRRA